MKLLNVFKKYNIKNYKFSLIVLVCALTFMGIMIIGSARESVQNRQILGFVIGAVAMVFISFIDYVWILNLYWVIYAGNIVLLLLVRFLGDSGGGAQRWFEIGSFRFQPAELSKIAVILFFAKFVMMHQDNLNELKTLVKAVLLVLPTFALILSQPDLSTTISIVLVYCVILYIGGLSYRYIGLAILVLIPVTIIFLSIVVQPDQKILSSYQQNRILAFLEPEKYANDEAFQQNNSIMAIGSGQLLGKGLNNNTTTSVKKGNFILEPQTDFIFAIVGEELGFVGSCIIIGLILVIVIQCILVGVKAQDLAGKIICCGIAAQIGFQSFINIGVATGMIPNTGIPLPFVSYGLTSLVSSFIGIGIVLNVGLQPKKYQS